MNARGDSRRTDDERRGPARTVSTRAIGGLVLSVSAYIAGGPGIALGQGVVTPPEAIELLAQAERANEARYPSGSMKVQISRGHRDNQDKNSDKHEVIQARSVWSGGFVRTELSRWGPSNTIPTLDEPAYERETCILDRSKSILYPNTHIVVIEPIAGKDIGAEYQLTPKNYWYASQVGQGFPAVKVFDPSVIGKELPNTMISLGRATPNILHLRLKRKTEDLSFDSWFSLDLDGNPTRCETIDVSEGIRFTRLFTWDRDRKGRVYLKKLDRKRVTEKGGGHTTMEYEEAETIDFDPDYRPDAAIFRLASIRVKANTVVDDGVSGKTYRLGDRDTASLLNSWDDLIELMRSRGFSSRSR